MTGETGANVFHLHTHAAKRSAQEVFQMGRLLTNDEVQGIEDVLRSDEFCAERRIALAVCLMDGPLFEGIASMPRADALAVAVNASVMQGHVDALRSLADTIDAARERLEVGLLVRDDALELIAEAQDVAD